MDVISSAKTDMFRMRINPEVRQNLEAVYAKNGLTLTDAVNVFFQQSLNAGGFPFQVTEGNAGRARHGSLKIINMFHSRKPPHFGGVCG